MYYTRIFLFVKFSGHGESWEWLSIGYWREVRGGGAGLGGGDQSTPSRSLTAVGVAGGREEV